jgi:predicted AlkP superfamily pyrophosphatase or phosphodiesterase
MKLARTVAKSSSFVFILALFLAVGPVFVLKAAPPSDKHVVVISMDGMRPDVLLRAKAPNIRALADRGSFTFWAESTDVAITLPTHVSMFTGVAPAKHRVTWNDDRDVEPSMLAVPTLFDLTKKAGYSNAMIVGKSKLAILAKPGMVDWLSVPEKKVKPDALTVSARGVEILRQHKPGVLFLHYPDPDTVGHAAGWGSPAQVEVADKADQGVGMIVAALRELGLAEKTLLIVTADHGGSGRSHGAKVAFSHYIPWIAVGPGVRENYDLTLEPALTVRVVDVFATALDFLGVAVPADVDGKPVSAIFGKSEKAEPKRKKKSFMPLQSPSFDLACVR